MKRFIFFFVFVIVSYLLHCQDSIVIHGANINDAYINSVYDQPNGHKSSLIASHWTYFEGEGIGRSLIKFDLSGIPDFSNVEYAQLSLYHDPVSSHTGHSDLGGDNTGIIMRVIQNWRDEEVTWYTQPITTNTNVKILPAPENENTDYPDIDITNLVQDMLNHPDLQQGLIVKLFSEDSIYRSLVFASVDHPNSNLRPELFIKYRKTDFVDSIIKLKPGPAKGNDAYINSVDPNPDGEEKSLIASVWTHNGVPGVGRFLIHFSLPTLPENYKLYKAEINFHHDPNPDHIGHSTMGGDNSLVIRRITEQWSENTISWNNQPSTTTEDETFTNPSNLSDQSYTNIDVTEMVKFMNQHPTENYGFQVKLIEEESMYRSVVFASSDHPDSTLWPSLELFYTDYLNTEETSFDKIDFVIYPNPNDGKFILQFCKELKEEVDVEVFNLSGRVVHRKILNNQSTIFNLSDQPDGIYLLKFEIGGRLIVKKVII
jgi:hypothetical protein